jgi:Arc/MetJ-type ribon-helix-helix transcriptional regulator
MTIKIRRPELERMVREEIQTGHFRNAEDLLTEALHAWREKHRQETPSSSTLERYRLAAEHIHELRKGNFLPDGVTIRDLINEGRD